MFYRARFLLRITRQLHLPACHGAVSYSLMARAFGVGATVEDGVPDGLLLDAPEQGRTRATHSQLYALGGTFLGPPEQATARCRQVADGLARLGAGKPGPGATLGGNFRLHAVQDLVTGSELAADGLLAPIPADHLAAEFAAARELRRLTLRFSSPLRMRRGRAHQETGHAFFDGKHFEPLAFFRRLAGRLVPLGLTGEPFDDSLARGVRVIENRLVWLDMEYGPQNARKTLGGAAGEIRLGGVPPEWAELLVLGQYARLGENTRFGFGAYRLAELGDDPFACPRAHSLAELAFLGPGLDRAAEQYGVPSGVVQVAARQVREGTYEPGPPLRIPWEKEPGEQRYLSVPQPVDRALQRVVLDEIAPALDLLFEESSLAYRKGLGRNSAAKAVQAAFRAGFRFAVRADFRRFFDTIDHDVLRDRLLVYLADPFTVDLILRWVRNGSFGRTRGLPIGAPLSPLLANLFLDQFDEEIAKEGGRLVRYADDFLILVRDRDDADRLHATAEMQARRLLLQLNAEKTQFLDFSQPFEFLGFRFEKQERWEVTPGEGPKRIEDLGWHDVSRRDPRKSALIVLPGETGASPAPDGATVVLGPSPGQGTLRDGRLTCKYENGVASPDVPLDRIRQVLLLGPVALDGPTLLELASRRIPLLAANTFGTVIGCLSPPGPYPDPETLWAQADAARDEGRRLAVARRLVVAKLRNHAALAAAWRRSPQDDLDRRLLNHAEAAGKCESLAALLGHEGAGAAAWYADFGKRLPAGFSFPGRKMPLADDPINVLLNIAQTALHHQCLLAVQQAGLAPLMGLMHQPRAGHAALASDLQEPFRHLMDRAVIESLTTITPQVFHPADRGPYKLRIERSATRHLAAVVHRMLASGCRAQGQTDSRTYLMHLQSNARALRRHLLDPNEPFVPFEHDRSDRPPPAR